MSKKLVIAVVVVVALIAVGCWYWWSTRETLAPEQEALKRAAEGANAITESVIQGVLPSLDVSANPVGEVTDVNPVNKANPFSGMETNPFK